MANVSFYRGSQANLNALTSYVDGRFYLTTDTDRLYVAQSADELVELNKSIHVIDSYTELPKTTATTSTKIKGNEVEVGQFYYIKGTNLHNGQQDSNGNILAVCTDITDGNITWVQVNPDTNTDHNDDTYATNVSFTKNNSQSTTSQLVFDVSIGQKTHHITGADTNSTAATGTLTISSSDITNIVAQTAVDVGATVSDNKATVSTSGSGASGSGFTINGSENVTISSVTGGIKVEAKDTKYTLSMPAVSGATAATSAALTVTPSEGGAAYNLLIKTGEDLAINNTTAGEMTIYHKNSGVSAKTYGDSATTPAAGSAITIPKITVDAQGHITSASDVSVTLPSDTKATGINVSGGNIILNQSSGASVSATSALYYQVTKYTNQTTSSTTTVYNQGNLGNFYTKEAIDAMLQNLDALTYKGTLGTATGATTSTLPAHPGNGDTYKVVTAGEYAGYDCKVGDLLIATGTETDGAIASPSWTLVANGDDTDTTYTFSVADNAIKVLPKGGTLTTIATIEGGNVLTASTNGTTIKLDHDTSGVTTGTYGQASAVTATAGSSITIPKITVDKYGHITSATGISVKLPAAASLKTNTATAGLKFNAGSGADYDIAVSGGTAITTAASTSAITISHANVTHTTTANGGANGQALSAEGTFDVVSAVAVNDQGHVTNVTTQKYKLPVDHTYAVSATNNSVVLHATAGSGADTSVKFSSDNLTITTTTSTNDIKMNLEWGSF